MKMLKEEDKLMRDLGTKRLETDRLILRKVSLEDVHQIFINWASDKKTNEYLTFKCHKEESQTLKMVNNMIQKNVSKNLT